MLEKEQNKGQCSLYGYMVFGILYLINGLQFLTRSDEKVARSAHKQNPYGAETIGNEKTMQMSKPCSFQEE